MTMLLGKSPGSCEGKQNLAPAPSHFVPSVHAVLCEVLHRRRTEPDNFVRIKIQQTRVFALDGALEVKQLISRILHFLSFLHTSFFVRLGIPFLRPDPHVLEAGAHRGCQGRPSLWPGGTLSRLQAAP
jgi:hypothetical protein